MKYTQMITITLLLLLQSTFPLQVHAETVDSKLSALNQEFGKHYYSGGNGRATMIAMKALEIAEKTVGPDHPDMATSLNNYALLYYKQEHYAEAEPLFKRALMIREKALGPDHPVVAASLRNLIALYYIQHKYNLAEPLAKRVVAIDEKMSGSDHKNVSASLVNLATVYQDQGKYAQAEPLFKRWLSIMEKAFGPDHPAVSVSLDNLASLYQDQGEYAKAERLFKRALTIREKVPGTDHTDVVMSLDNLASLYQEQSKYAQAEHLLKRALTINKKVLGAEHMDVSASQGRLAILYQKQEKIVQALSAMKDAQQFLYDFDATKYTSLNKTLSDAFNKRCGTEQMSLLGFPDVYLNPNELAACEIAFIIDPKRFANQHKTKLMAQSINKSTTLDSDQHEATNIIYNHFKEMFQTEPTDVDLALAGHPDSFHNLLVKKVSLSAEQRVSMYQLIGKSMTELFLGRFIEPEYKHSEADLLITAEQILNYAQFMSGVVLRIAMQNYRSALARFYENKTVAEMYLSMPLNLRKSLLALASITNSFSHEEISVMQAIQFGITEHDFSAFTKGDRESYLDKRILEYPEAEFIWLSINIVEVTKGAFLPQKSMSILEKLRTLTNFHPQLIQQYAKYFPDIDYDAVLSIDIESLGKRYERALRNRSVTDLSEFEISLLVSDIRTVATLDLGGEFYGYLDLITPDNPLVVDLIDSQENPLINLAFTTMPRKIKDEWGLLFDLEDAFKETINNINDVCLTLSEEMCDRMWRNIMLYHVTFNDVNINTGKCQNSPLIIPAVLRQLSAGHMDLFLAARCSLDSLKIMLKKNDIDVISIMTKIVGSGQRSSRALLNNKSFIMGGGGLVAKHIYNTYQDEQILLLPTMLTNLTNLDGVAWTYLNKISENPVPEGTRSDPLFRGESYTTYGSLAFIYSIMANHERALLTQLNGIEMEYGELIGGLDIMPKPNSLYNLVYLKQYARNSGMPEPYINLLIDRNKKVINKIPDTISIQYIMDFIDQQNHQSQGPLKLDPNITRELHKKSFPKGFEMTFLKEFLSNGDLKSVLSLLDDLESDEVSLRLVGKILALSQSDQEELCKNIVFQKFTRPNSNKLSMLLWSNRDTINGGPFSDFGSLFYEFVKFDSRCTYLWIEEKSKFIKEGDYEHMFKNLLLSGFMIEEVKSKGLFTDPRYSDFMLLLSEYAVGTGNLNGLVASLITIKHSFELMADAYIYRNSATWRLKMPDIETVIVNTAKALRDAKNDSKKQTAIYSRLMRRTESLAASAHAIFVSDRTRARMLDVENKTFTDVADDASIRSNTTAYNKMTEYFHKARNSLAASKTVFEAIVNKASFGEHGIQALPRFYKAAAQIEKAIASPKEVFPTSNNSVLLNILSNGKQIFFQLLDDKGRYLSDTLDIQASLASRLKERITRNTRITADDIKLGCEAFASVHQVLKPLTKDYSRLVVVPSVNLLPIPTELIIGTACDSSDATIIHTADVLGAIELMRSDQGIHLPQSFVGIGNPSLPMESNQIKIAAVDGGNKEIIRNLSAVDEFKPLPDAEEEIQEIAEIFSDTSIFTAAEGSIMKGLDAAQMNRQKGKNSAIVLATHGVGLDLGQGFELPSLLSVEDGQPTLVGATSVQQFDLDGAVVVLSACDTAAGLYEKPEMMFTGFVESFADAQSSFIVASLLPVRSQASKQHTVAFFRALKKGDIWQAVRAGKKAVSNATDSLPFVSIYP